MESNAAIEYEPVYGWGWFQGAEAFGVPARLIVGVATDTPTLVTGVVLDPPELARAEVALSLRNEFGGKSQWSATFSGGTLEAPVTGFVQSLGCTPNNSFKPNPLR